MYSKLQYWRNKMRPIFLLDSLFNDSVLRTMWACNPRKKALRVKSHMCCLKIVGPFKNLFQCDINGVTLFRNQSQMCFCFSFSIPAAVFYWRETGELFASSLPRLPHRSISIIISFVWSGKKGSGSRMFWLWREKILRFLRRPLSSNCNNCS